MENNYYYTAQVQFETVNDENGRIQKKFISWILLSGYCY